MADNFLKEQLELLKKLNERVSKIQDEVSHNVELLARQRVDAEHRAREERVYRQRDPGNERRKAPDHAKSHARLGRRHRS
jgi:hypothetical protein